MVTFFFEFLLARPSVRRTIILPPRGYDSSAFTVPYGLTCNRVEHIGSIKILSDSVVVVGISRKTLSEFSIKYETVMG